MRVALLPLLVALGCQPSVSPRLAPGPIPTSLADFVSEAPELAPRWPCAPVPSGICAEDAQDYLALAQDLAPELDLPHCQWALRRSLKDEVHRRQNQDPLWAFPRPERIGPEIIELLGLDPWRADVGTEALRIASTLVAGGERHDLFLLPPRLGLLPAVLVLPDGWLRAPELPVVLGLPGHRDTADDFLVDYAGPLLDQGIAVLAVTFRAYDAGWHETDATTALLCAGSSMVAARNIEVLAALAWLEALKREGFVTSVGLMGHSGGSVITNLLQWYAPVEAAATDHRGEYLNVSAAPPGGVGTRVLDETHVPLSLLRFAVITYGESPIPVLVEPYGYELDPEHAVTGVPTFPGFFASALFR